MSLQRRLRTHGYFAGRVDGVYGPRTATAVRRFQGANGLVADGVAGPLTVTAVASRRGGPVRPGAGYRSAGGDVRVRDVQRMLRATGYDPGAVDGRFGQQTQAAVQWFQAKHRLRASGVVDAASLRQLRRLTRGRPLPSRSTPRLAAPPLPSAGWHGRPIRNPRPEGSAELARWARTHGPVHPLGLGAGYRTQGGSPQVRRIQRVLHQLGYESGPVDGRFGPRTLASVQWVQMKYGVAPSGTIDVATVGHLRALARGGAPAKTSPEQVKASPAPPQGKPAQPGGEANAQAVALGNWFRLGVLLVLFGELVAELTGARVEHRRGHQVNTIELRGTGSGPHHEDGRILSSTRSAYAGTTCPSGRMQATKQQVEPELECDSRTEMGRPKTMASVTMLACGASAPAICASACGTLTTAETCSSTTSADGLRRPPLRRNATATNAVPSSRRPPWKTGAAAGARSWRRQGQSPPRSPPPEQRYGDPDCCDCRGDDEGCRLRDEVVERDRCKQCRVPARDANADGGECGIRRFVASLQPEAGAGSPMPRPPNAILMPGPTQPRLTASAKKKTTPRSVTTPPAKASAFAPIRSAVDIVRPQSKPRLAAGCGGGAGRAVAAAAGTGSRIGCGGTGGRHGRRRRPGRRGGAIWCGHLTGSEIVHDRLQHGDTLFEQVDSAQESLGRRPGVALAVVMDGPTGRLETALLRR